MKAYSAKKTWSCSICAKMPWCFVTFPSFEAKKYFCAYLFSVLAVSHYKALFACRFLVCILWVIIFQCFFFHFCISRKMVFLKLFSSFCILQTMLPWCFLLDVYVLHIMSLLCLLPCLWIMCIRLSLFLFLSINIIS